jgi:hypothetical protein
VSWRFDPLAVLLGAFACSAYAIAVARNLYPNYAAAGLADQQTAGEIMWIGGTLGMFVAEAASTLLPRFLAP